MELNTIALIGLGGVVGAVSRYLISGWVQNNNPGFPYGTLFVNFTGALALSIIMYLSEYSPAIPPNVRIFLTIGILCAYTTMSTFGYESFRLLEQGDNMRFALYLLATNGLVIAGVLMGKLIAQRITSVVV